MEVLIDFLLNNYIWFLVISLILIFALIGYLVDTTAPKGRSNKNVIRESNETREVKMHPSLEIYTNEVFDDPLISEKNAQ